MFDDDADYAAIEKVLAETQADVFVRMLSHRLMPNHWHLVLWALQDGDLERFPQSMYVAGTCISIPSAPPPVSRNIEFISHQGG